MDLLNLIPLQMWVWGPGFMLGFLVLVGVYLIVRQALRALGGAFARLAGTVVSEFITAQKSQAEAMGRQATAMTNLASSVQAQSERSFFGHERVLLQLRVLHEDNDGFRDLVRSMQAGISATSSGIADVQSVLAALPCSAGPGCKTELRRVIP